MGPWTKAVILIAGDNFGCGSSREHAPWSILDFGIRCVISTSFADIFYNNCFKNGMLPIKLPRDQVELLMADADDGKEIEVDLEAKVIRRRMGTVYPSIWTTSVGLVSWKVPMILVSRYRK